MTPTTLTPGSPSSELRTLGQILLAPDLGDQDKVLFLLIFEDWRANKMQPVEIEKYALAQRVGKSFTAIHHSMKKLVKCGYLTQQKQARRPSLYGLAKTVIWCGSEPVELSNSARRPKSRPSLDRARPSFSLDRPSSLNISIISNDDGPSSSFLKTKLRGFGLSPKCADRLLATHDSATIANQIAALPHRRPKNPAAVLTASIVNNWDLPRSYGRIVERADAALFGAQIRQRETHNRSIAGRIQDDQRKFEELPAELRAELTHKAAQYASDAAKDANERRQLFDLEKLRLMRLHVAGAA